MNEKPAKIFTCEMCGIACESTSSEDETEQELKENFPGYTKEECVPVCNRCYKIFMAHWN